MKTRFPTSFRTQASALFCERFSASFLRRRVRTRSCTAGRTSRGTAVRWGLALVIAILPAAGSPAGEPGPNYKDPDRPVAERVADLLSRMTLEEKISQMTYKSPPIERLEVPGAYWWNQCLSGVVSPHVTTQFPCCIALSATWDPELVNEVATAISDEARALYVMGADNRDGKHGLFYRAPVINISRDPRWGRIHEVWGEDPHLTSRLGVAYVRGLQGDHPRYLKLVSTLKHFACNNEETRRLSGSSEVPERMLREYWLPHFRACVVEGKAMSIMAAYNAINGVPCNINKRLLTEILRDEWGFEGFVVSDTSAIRHLVERHKTFANFEEASAAAVKAGVDLDGDQFNPVLVESVRRGLLSEKEIDASVSRILTAKFRLGVFDPPGMCPYNAIPPETIDSPKHRELARRANRRCLVLLKNDGLLLPLDKKALRSVAVIGPHGDRCYFGPGYVGRASESVTPLEGIRNAVGPTTEVRFAKGCEIVEARDDGERIAGAAVIAKASDVAIVFVGTDGRIEAESRDRTTLGLPGAQQRLVQAVFEANPRTVVVLINGGPLAIEWTAEHVPAIVEAFFGGEELGNALADVLFGDYGPGGRLPYTVYRSAEELPPPDEYDVSKGFTYMYMKGRPLYPFGHGLSYTRFEYGEPKIAPATVAQAGEARIALEVRNAGSRAGDEIVQLYVRDVEASEVRPAKALKGFQRIRLAPGEARKVEFRLPAGELAFYNVGRKAFVVEPGEFEIMVGSSSEDIRRKARLTVAAPR